MSKYSVGDYVMHESAGVCRVESIDVLALQGRGSEKSYYRLKPVYHSGGEITTPVDDKNHRVRDVKPSNEMEDILHNVDKLGVIREKNERARQEKIKEQVALFDPAPLAGVVKSAYLRKQKRLAAGKKTMSSDERVLETVGRKLFEEMAFSMHTKPDDVEEQFFMELDQL
jgi:CarD family transcriptional regulator